MMDTTLRPQMHWEQAFDARLGRSHPQLRWILATPAVRPEPVVPAPAARRELAAAAA